MNNTQKRIIKGLPATRALDGMLTDVLIYIESALKLDESLPRCPCCGATENLTSGYAGGNLIWLCPDAAAEERQR